MLSLTAEEESVMFGLIGTLPAAALSVAFNGVMTLPLKLRFPGTDRLLSVESVVMLLPFRGR